MSKTIYTAKRVHLGGSQASVHDELHGRDDENMAAAIESAVTELGEEQREKIEATIQHYRDVTAALVTACQEWDANPDNPEKGQAVKALYSQQITATTQLILYKIINLTEGPVRFAHKSRYT